VRHRRHAPLVDDQEAGAAGGGVTYGGPIADDNAWPHADLMRITASVADALKMQRPLPDRTLRIVRGEKEDGATTEMATAEPRLL
jgi:hypothetical protein